MILSIGYDAFGDGPRYKLRSSNPLKHPERYALCCLLQSKNINNNNNVTACSLWVSNNEMQFRWQSAMHEVFRLWLIVNETEVKSFVNSVCCYGRQPVKTNLFNKIMEMQVLLKTNRTFFLFQAHLTWLRGHMKGQKMYFLEMWFSLWISDTVRQMTFWFPHFKLFFYHPCMKYASYELYQMKEEDLSFTNMCHLLIIIVIKLW